MDFYVIGINLFLICKNLLIIMVPILINKDVFEPSYNDLKFTKTGGGGEEPRWQRRQNLVAQFIQLLKHWSCHVWSYVVMEKNWARSVDQCWLQVLQFSVHLINLLSILLSYNGFTRIQKL